ncbi:2-oxoglutarate dehydrogenase complex dihydrolipoyllysine-residue succinyltransferase, partial [Gammaproteobacteria bacterium]|nr:2-oxoglutarate dehydrogenase complex dihydrolipoyllysine-residue succinyltransferase [Gammaproteobacteria bacterium]
SEVIGEFSESDATNSSQPKVENLVEKNDKTSTTSEQEPQKTTNKNGPAANKLISENNLDASSIKASGKDNRITKADVVNHLDAKDQAPKIDHNLSQSVSNRPEKRVSMTRLRSTIAKRLVSVQQETAMLTTFNEVDMLPIKELRAKYGQEFEKQHDVKLGFMGFFVIAAVQALKKSPIVNASIDGGDVVYHGYQDIGVAVSTERGLVVPIIKDADTKSLPELEKSILEYSEKARDGKLSIDEMQGGTFTISNGGVFGSLLSTPILNAPQTAILGMHTIQERPVARNGEVVIRPMMYLAMSYDHRLLDGKEAVRFLVSIKEQLESPERLLLNL